MPSASAVRRAVFVDRDGVINDLVPDPATGAPESPYAPEDVRILPFVEEALGELAHAGFTLVVVSNQPAEAKGRVGDGTLAGVHAAVVEALGDAAGAISLWSYCEHHPDAIDPARRSCECRKPKPGLLLDAARRLEISLAGSWTVGDADRDIVAGAAAGTATILVEHPGSSHRRATPTAAPTARDFRDAARRILAEA